MCCLAQTALLQVLFIKFVPGVKSEEQRKRSERDKSYFSINNNEDVSFLFCLIAVKKQQSVWMKRGAHMLEFISFFLLVMEIKMRGYCIWELTQSYWIKSKELPSLLWVLCQSHCEMWMHLCSSKWQTLFSSIGSFFSFSSLFWELFVGFFCLSSC